MRKLLTMTLSLIVMVQLSQGSEKTVISQWLQAGPLEARFPAFHTTANVEGKPFSYPGLLSFEHLDLSNYYPEQGMELPWLWQQKTTWQQASTDANGYVMIAEGNQQPLPEIAYLAAYIKADRWINTKLEIKSPYMLQVWLNGKLLTSKNTVEHVENTIGRLTHELKLTRGNHLLIIKTLRPTDGSLDWKVMANLETSPEYSLNDLNFNLSPQNIKNISHVLDGIKVTRADPSPDGSFYISSYSRSQPPGDQSETWSEIKRMTDSKLVYSFRHSRISRLAWLPQTNAVSYTTNHNGKSSIHLLNIETGEQSLLMQDVDKLSGLRWSPDESYFIYTLREEGDGTDGTLRQIQGMRDRLPGWRNRDFLYKYDMNTGVRTRLTWGNMSTSLHDISPDGSKLLIGQNYADYTQRPYSKSNLFILDINTMEADTLFADQPWGFSASFSPDGTRLLATGGASAFDRAGENIADHLIANNYDRQAYIYDLSSREITAFTRDFHPSVSNAWWHAGDNNIYLHVVEEDFQRIYRYEVSRDRFTMLGTGFDLVSNVNLSARAGIITYRANQANSPHAFYTMNLRNQRSRLLEDTESANYRHVEFGQVNDWHHTVSSGVEVKGRYYLPPDFDADKSYPVIVYYYGGTTPVGRTFGGRYPFNLWAANGYVVYVLQPSGATGFGQEFSAAHVNNWGITVADEIIESTQAFLEAHSFTDPSRVGCAGASYGGFMTMLLTTRTDMFAGAISHAGISSISSYWGEGYWGYSYSAEATAESFPWSDPQIYVGQSPLFHADRITTPLLLITGDSDTNVPPGESIQMYTALKILDRPVELVLVKGENHHIVTYSKRIEWHNTIMAWWDKQLKGQPQWWHDIFPQKNY